MRRAIPLFVLTLSLGCNAINGTHGLTFTDGTGGAGGAGGAPACGDVRFDRDNCGACGHTCAPQHTCWEGACSEDACGQSGWRLAASPGGVEILDLAFLPGPLPTLGFAARQSGADVAVTRDGAATWVAGPDECVDLYRVQSPDGQHVFLGGAGGCFLRSSDGGETWSRSIVPGGNHLYGGAYFFRAEVGLALRGAGLPPLRSTDGGATWTALDEGPIHGAFLHRPIPVPGQPEALQLVVSTLESPTVVTHWATLDEGATWTHAPIAAASSTFVSVGGSFGTSTHGWAAAEDGSLIRTTDGGITWTALAPAPLAIREVAFLDERRGFAAGSLGDTGRVYRTEDGGETWQLEDTPPVGCLRSIEVSPSGWAVASSVGGDILVRCP